MHALLCRMCVQGHGGAVAGLPLVSVEGISAQEALA